MGEKTLHAFYPRKLTQAHVENLHSQIRGYGGFNDHPNAHDYTNALRCLACKFSTTELVEAYQSDKTNCEQWEDSLPAAEAEAPKAEATQTEALESEDATKENQPDPTLDVAFQNPGAISGDNLTPLEEETTIYIAGAVCHKMQKNTKACSECISLCIDDTAPLTVFSEHKSYADNSLVNTSIALRELVQDFEKKFKVLILQAFASTHPREFILHAFMDSEEFMLQMEHFTCSQHGHKIVMDFLRDYAVIRLFHEVKLFNQRLRVSKRGNELNKDRKLNL